MLEQLDSAMLRSAFVIKSQQLFIYSRKCGIFSLYSFTSRFLCRINESHILVIQLVYHIMYRGGVYWYGTWASLYCLFSPMATVNWTKHYTTSWLYLPAPKWKQTDIASEHSVTENRCISGPKKLHLHPWGSQTMCNWDWHLCFWDNRPGNWLSI